MKYVKGFTLIEILVSVGILSIISVFVVQSILTVIRAGNKAELLKEIKQSGDQALDVIRKKVINAESITCPNVNQLSIDELYPDGASTQINSEVFGTACQIKLTYTDPNGSSSDYLTPNNITLADSSCPSTGIYFDCGSNTPPTSVEVSFSLKQIGSPTSPSDRANMDFKTVINLRNK